MVRRYNLEGWEAVKRQWDQLRVQLRLKREAWRKDNERLLEVLMTEPSTSSLRKKMAFSFKAIPVEKSDIKAGKSDDGKLQTAVVGCHCLHADDSVMQISFF